jgi:hypothetical protein
MERTRSKDKNGPIIPLKLMDRTWTSATHAAAAFVSEQPSDKIEHLRGLTRPMQPLTPSVFSPLHSTCLEA